MMKRVLVVLVVLMGLAGGGSLRAQQADELSMKVLHLDGRSGYVVLPSGAFDGLTEATVEAWVRWEQFNAWGRVFDFGREGNAVLLLNEKRSSTVRFAIYDRKGKDHRTKAEKLIAPGVWRHLAAVCGPGGMELYVDGKLADSDRYEGGLEQAAGGQNYVGKSNWPGDELFQGFVAEFRVWNRRRTREEIVSRMDRLLTGREPGLVGCWRFNRAEGGSTPDDGPSGMPASLMGGAQIVTVPAIERYLVPGELEKAAENVYASGRVSLGQGDYIAAYKDFEAALDLVPGFKDAEALMREAVEKGRYSLAVSPVVTRAGLRGSEQASRPGALRRAWEALSESGTVDLLRQEEGRAALEEGINWTLFSEVSKGLPPYVDLVTRNRLDWALKGKGLDARRADPAQVVRAAGAAGIRVVALGEVEVASLRYDSDRMGRRAFLVREVTYLDQNGQEKKEKEKAGEHTYYVVKKDARMTCRVSYRVVEAETGDVLKEDFVEEEVRDGVEYADPNGVRRQDLWVERYGNLVRLEGEDDRFRAREKLRGRAELTSEAAAALGAGLAERILSFVDGYRGRGRK